MSLQSWLLYLSFVFIATATPGPAVFFIITKSGLYGWRKAVFSALGNIMGLLALGIVAVTGLGAVLQASETLFAMVRYAGAAYLIYLGVVQLCHRSGQAFSPDEANAPGQASSLAIFAQAFGVAVSNPKAIVFLTALFPQFIAVDQPLVPQFVALMLTLMGFSFSFLMGYALVADRARAWLARPNRADWIQKISGGVFIGFGLVMAGSSRNG